VPPTGTPTSVPPTEAPGEPILILAGGTLIDGTGSPPMPDAVVVIRGKHILAVGRRADATLPAGVPVIDVAGATILPGFINAHVHGGYDATALAEWAQGGVTTVRDMAARPSLVNFAFRDETWANPNLARLVVAGPMVTVPDGYPIAYWGMPALTVTSATDAQEKVAALLDQGADFIKIALESGAIFGQQMPMLSPEEATAIVQVAHSRGKPVSAHVTVAADLPGALDAGVDDIAHMATDRVSDATIQRMVEASVYWVPTLELWQGVGLRRAAIADNLRRFVAASGQVALGTDYLGAPNVDFDLGMPITEIELMAQAGMTPMQIIVAATRNAAHVCGLERELGTLEPGKLADVLVVDGDPLTDVHVLTQTRLVLRDGVIIMQEAAPTVKIDGYKNLGVFSLPRHVHRPDLPPIGFPRRFDEPAGVFLGGLIGHNKRVVHSAG
jgi:imidazolonepropionase-like amidohydrolase